MIEQFYKLARPDGWDFYTGETINYREAAQATGRAKIVKVPRPNLRAGLCSSGVIHASREPNGCFLGYSIPCSAYRVEGKPLLEDAKKCGFLWLRILDEIPVSNFDEVFGWKYSEAANPINPLLLRKRIPIDEDLILLREWASVRNSVRNSVEDSVAESVAESVGESVWESVRNSVAESVAESVWESVRNSVTNSVRYWPWESIRNSLSYWLWHSVMDSVAAYIGSFFTHVELWKYIRHDPGDYPYSPAVELWKRGLAASCIRNIWRLHSGENAEIVWEGELTKRGV